MKTCDALERLGRLYVKFLKHAEKREKLFKEIESLTEIILNDKKVVNIVKDSILKRRETFRGML